MWIKLALIWTIQFDFEISNLLGRVSSLIWKVFKCYGAAVLPKNSGML